MKPQELWTLSFIGINNSTSLDEIGLDDLEVSLITPTVCLENVPGGNNESNLK